MAFFPAHCWLLAPPAIGLWFALVVGQQWRRAALMGYAYGIGFNAVAIHWAAVLGWAVLLVFVAWLAIWQALTAVAIALTKRWGIALGVGAACWMAGEWLCARWPFGGFGWTRLGYAMVDTPIDGLFPLISVGGLSLICVGVAALLAMVITWASTWRRQPLALRLALLISLALLVVLALVFSAIGRSYQPSVDQRQIRVAVIQGNVPGKGIDALGPRYTVERNHLAQTIILAAEVATGRQPRPDFVVWPENSTATDPSSDPVTTALINQAVDIIGVPILVGAIVDGPGDGQRQTVGLWWGTDHQVTARYAKRNLVPFGEWVPFKDALVKIIPVLAKTGATSVPGTTIGVLDVTVDDQRLRIGDLICFEVSYDQTVDQIILGDDLVGGAQIVALQTSNAMFTGSDQMIQQDAITRARAMETRRDILIATTNSLAGLVDAQGQVVDQASLETADDLVFTVHTSSAVTPAVAGRSWFDLLGVVAPLLAAGLSVIIKRRRHSD
jgi:apolipoprotein N-acyltransferase